MELPEGWREEIIALPPEFAPDLSWRGTEALAFSPGMFKEKSDSFFSYVFTLHLEEGEPDWGSQLPIYFRGLAKAVSKDPNLDTSLFQLSLQGTKRARFGTFRWVEPFVTKKEQILYLELRRLGDRDWFVCASPQHPSQEIWTEMRILRNRLELSL